MTAPKPLIATCPDALLPKTQLLAMSGFEYVTGMLEGRLPAPAISALMGFALSEVAQNRVALSGTPTFSHTNPFGAVHGGWYGTILDSALGSAVMTMVPRGRWYTTLEYKVNITRALPVGMEVEAIGLLDHIGRSTAVAHATLHGLADGRLYATASTTCIILE